MPKCTRCGSTAQVRHLTGGAWMCDCGQLFWYEESETPAPVPSLQEELHRLYCRVIIELEPRSLFDDDFQNAFQALSEAIEYHGGGKHKNYLYDDSADCEIIGAGGEVWTGSIPSWD